MNFGDEILISVDWASFTPLPSLVGGALIGLAAVVLFLGCGRVAGISGILGECLQGLVGEGRGWRLAFLGGLLLAPWIATGVGVAGGKARFDVSLWVLLFAGLLTGYGTRIARGCTSGHGVCGLSRLSPRSLVAVLSFMVAGMFTVTVLRMLLERGL